ncbi:hemoblobin-interacting domain-containing protein [Paenibacillus chungangensis]|uniref:Hemoblobin-interacting domain-containing protein n=1 Tax=Paenibacillus chungangensis TaxID=696535 RepID=A0ABW3HRR4_9BACL
MIARDRLRPKRMYIMLTIVFIYFLSFGGNVAIEPAEASERDSIFTDIQPGSEYTEALNSLVTQGIISGYSDGTFRPSQELNREQAAVILARALQLNLETVDNPNFQDVNEDSIYYKSIAAVVRAGIFQGYSDGTLRPEQSLTRSEMAKILVVAYQLPIEELVVNPFDDVSSTSWYAPYLTSMIKHKITAGTSLTTYSPNHALTRGEMALFIYRCQQVVQQTERIIESKLMAITPDSVQLGNESFALADDLKTWLTPENLPILMNSQIKAHVSRGIISRIESITLYNEKKNLNLALTGNGSEINATVIIKGDHLSIKDAIITKDLIIESDVQNSFYLENVQVKGSTNLSNSQEVIKNKHNPKLHVHDSILQSVNVALENYTILLTGETKVNEIDLFVNTSIEADTGITIPIIRVGSEALRTVIHAVIDSLFVENMNSRITLGNDAKIEDLRLKLRDHVNIIFVDYELIKHKIIKINGVPNIDLQPVPGGGSPNSGQNTKLITAKNAVASLFSDSTKTALKAGVDQDAIDDAKGKVDQVVNGADKSSLLADLQVAQQLLNALLEAIANLHAATEAVNALFTDSTKTALKADVDQDAIDAAEAKVNRVADGAEKSALKQAIETAQDLLNQLLIAPTLTGTAPNAETVQFTFADDAAWRGEITGVYLNGNSAPIHSSRVNTATAGMIEIDLTGTPLPAGTHQFLIQAEGYADAVVTIEVAAPLTAPTLTGAAPNAETVQFTFADDAAWRGEITGVYLNGNSAPIHTSRVNRSVAGVIEIDLTGAPLPSGTHQFLIQAEGYADAVVTIEVTAPLTTPTLTGTAPDAETIQFTFSDDAAWRGEITGVYLNGNSAPIHTSRVNRSVAGVIEIDLTGAPLPPGTHQFLIQAEGYGDAVVTIEVTAPLTAPTVTGTAPNTETVQFTFADDAAWRGEIIGVYLNGNSMPIHISRVNTATAGIIEIDLTGAPLPPGTHQFLIQAEGYGDAVVTIEVAAPLTAPTLTGTALNTETVQFTFADDAAWRGEITGVYLNGNSMPIHISRVNTATAGIIEIDLTGAPLPPGTHQFLIQAEGYWDVLVPIMIEP